MQSSRWSGVIPEFERSMSVWAAIVEKGRIGHGMAIVTAAAQAALSLREVIDPLPDLVAQLAEAEAASTRLALVLNRGVEGGPERSAAIEALTALSRAVAAARPVRPGMSGTD